MLELLCLNGGAKIIRGKLRSRYHIQGSVFLALLFLVLFETGKRF